MPDRSFEDLAPRAAALPPSTAQGYVEHDGARIRYAVYGSGPAVMLLHGGLGSGEEWGNQVPALTDAGYRAILIDSRGQGRSTRDTKPLSYELMATDVIAVMDALRLEACAVAGWSDGAIVAVTLALKSPARVTRVLAFGGNMDLHGAKELTPGDPVLMQMIDRLAADYARLSNTPTEFRALFTAVTHMMTTQPNYTASELSGITVPVTIVHSEHDEFIKPEHADYLARTIPNATLVVLPGAGHFAPLREPARFNAVLLAFLVA